MAKKGTVEKETYNPVPQIPSDEEPTMDIYIRMNEDFEKDYCFSVPTDAPISSLKTIFDTLPMVLSPSYFFNQKPIGFAVSREPGNLTSEGGLLFNESSDKEKFLQKIDQEAPIKSVVWEGQLIVPIWEFNYNRWTKVIASLLFWLYLDLPDHISPTPGNQPSAYLFLIIQYLMPHLEDDGEVPFSSVGWQYGFFALHILKCLFIYSLFYIGGANPVSMNPLKNRLRRKTVTKDDLLSIGWTGTRRATVFEWTEENRKTKIESVGGVVNAYHKGILDELRNACIKLKQGEGWDSPSPSEKPVDSAAALEDGKFIVDEEYFKLLYSPLADIIENEELDEQAKNTAIKAFRRNGPATGPEKIKEKFNKRRSFEPEDKKKK